MNMYRRFLVFSKRCGYGAAMIEFGFVAPIFITLLIGIFEVGTMLVIQNSLDAAAREAARFGLTGAGFKGSTRDKAIKNKVLDTIEFYSGGMADLKKVKITVSAYEQLERIGQPEPFDDANGDGIWTLGEYYDDVNGNGTWDEDQGVSDSFGVGGSAVMYVISYNWESVLPIFGGSVTLRGVSPVVNEYFNPAWGSI